MGRLEWLTRSSSQKMPKQELCNPRYQQPWIVTWWEILGSLCNPKTLNLSEHHCNPALAVLAFLSKSPQPPPPSKPTYIPKPLLCPEELRGRKAQCWGNIRRQWIIQISILSLLALYIIRTYCSKGFIGFPIYNKGREKILHRVFIFKTERKLYM